MGMLSVPQALGPDRATCTANAAVVGRAAGRAHSRLQAPSKENILNEAECTLDKGVRGALLCPWEIGGRGCGGGTLAV